MPPHCVPLPKCVLPKRNHGHPDWLTCSAAEEGNSSSAIPGMAKKPLGPAAQAGRSSSSAQRCARPKAGRTRGLGHRPVSEVGSASAVPLRIKLAENLKQGSAVLTGWSAQQRVAHSAVH